jgi:hypothetical protein
MADQGRSSMTERLIDASGGRRFVIRYDHRDIASGSG